MVTFPLKLTSKNKKILTMNLDFRRTCEIPLKQLEENNDHSITRVNEISLIRLENIMPNS